jgi:prolyl-tRNA synthetase
MRQSHLFTKVSKLPPKDEEAVNAKLLTRAGFVRKISAGVYAFLPLGFRVLEKVKQIIREEMNAIGAQELLFSTLIAREYWEKSGRWGIKVGYEFKAPSGEEVALGWTHEEEAAAIATHFISSYKDLPQAVYQMQTKFRDEARAKSGLLRGREFLMKDLYSFHASKEDLDNYYNVVIGAYKKIFKRLSLPVRVTEAAGGAFTKEYTHEFQVLNPAGEDTVFYCAKCDWSRNKEIFKGKAGDACEKCGGSIQEANGIEVGNVFKLGTKYSDAFGVQFTDEKGEKKAVIMGSYGIGLSRIVGTFVEAFHDDAGMMWPDAVAPFRVHVLALHGTDKKTVAERADGVYDALHKAGVEVLYDDREISAGQKFSEADLIGIPFRAVVSEKAGEKVEVKRRDEKTAKLMTIKEFEKLVIK